MPDPALFSRAFDSVCSSGMPRVDPEAWGLRGQPSSHRIVVAMSGGVDSSLAAFLVANAGYETVGITLRLYDSDAAAKKGACCAGQDISDARRVAETLGISHYVLDYESRFREAVIDDFAASYLAGETPIPCVRCNQTVKFADLLETARGLGASALVTGHYVRSRPGPTGWQLLRAVDGNRDQSYFLFATLQPQLDFLRFPLGGLLKTETRALAERMHLPVANKPDSQDICFAPAGDYAAVIRMLRPDASAPGEVVDLNGVLLGHHDGIVNFTIGQRKGLGIATGKPLFVTAIDPASRQVTVGPRSALSVSRLRLRDVNWIGGGSFSDVSRSGFTVFVKIRSSQQPVAATLSGGDGCPGVVLSQPVYGMAQGQACVFYSSDGSEARLLGGGFVTETAA